MRRPHNHVVGRESAVTTPQLPLLERHQLERLRRQFPPRCKSPGEDIEQHAHYAGKVSLIADLVAVWRDTQHDDNSLEDQMDPLRDGERAS